MTGRRRMNAGGFSDHVQKYLRAGGYTQKELADELGLHPKVLSRKLNGSGKAHLTHLEVQRIITTLARWYAITTYDEAIYLLEAMGMEATIFSDDEWQSPPLSLLATRLIPSNSSNFSPSTHLHNLPALTTRLIGREWAVERLLQLFERSEVRLVTLVGAGGSGKTRLALHAANKLVGTFAQGVWFVALAGVSNPALVPMSIIQALNIQSMPGLPPLQSLIAYLHNKQLLLVLDNFEQVGAAATVVDEMLAASPGLKVLITSRAVLHLYGEHEFSVPPLDLPDSSSVPETKELAQYGAIQLFVERAQAVMPGFALTGENAAVIAQICARVDGLPLALELAAARVKVLPPALLIERLSQARLTLLTGGARNLPGRQQTLRNTIAWSYDLLSSAEQAWFRRLAIFSGGWSLEAAEAMMQGIATNQEGTAISVSPLDMLEQLVDNSLLIRLPDTGKQARFTMLETLREYALEQLVTLEMHERLRDWHACYYLEEAETAEIALRGPQQLVWLKRLGADRDNYRAALDWSLQRARDGLVISSSSLFSLEASEESEIVVGERRLSSKDVSCGGILALEVSLRLAASLRHYWEWQGQLTEARYWLGAALEIPLENGAKETVLAARARALSEDSRLVCLQNDQDRAAELAEESIALWRQLDHPSGLATALLHRGWAANATGDHETARCFYQEGFEHLSGENNIWLRAQLLFYLGAAAGFSSDFEQMHAYYKQSRALFEQLDDKCALADLLKDQGGMSILEGDYKRAIDCLLESIKLCYELDHKQFIATGMGWLSFAFGLKEEPDPLQASIHSAQIGGAADALMDNIGLTPWTKTLPLALIIRQQISSRVDEQSWERAWAEGRTLTVEQAIELVMRLGEELH